jgi:hypothetical protein
MTILTVVRRLCDGRHRAAVLDLLWHHRQRTMQEMLALANEMAQRIAYDLRDWTRLKKVQVFHRRRCQDGLRPSCQLQAHAADVGMSGARRRRCSR